MVSISRGGGSGRPMFASTFDGELTGSGPTTHSSRARFTA
jgi:hypothetical protein